VGVARYAAVLVEFEDDDGVPHIAGIVIVPLDNPDTSGSKIPAR
jgi:hypothetical protein